MKAAARSALETALAAFGSCEVTVGGGSMRPFIRPGDVVTITKHAGKPRLGSVVAFFLDGQLIVHRVTGYTSRGKDQWILRIPGDSSPGSRASIPSDTVVGCVTHVTRNNRKAHSWLRPPLSWLAIPAGFVFRFLARLKSGTAEA